MTTEDDLRNRRATALCHDEQIDGYTLQVRGVVCSFILGTAASLTREGKECSNTYGCIPSWVWCGKDAAIEAARSWARQTIARIYGEEWNGKYPVGTEVTVRRDGGEIRTRTSSPAFLPEGSGFWMIEIEAYGGWHFLDRVRPAETQKGEKE